MFKYIYLALVLGVFGCGVQGGRFVTTGSRSNALSSKAGCIDIVAGHEIKQTEETGIANEQNLLYVLIITAGLQEYGSSSSNDYGKYVTTLNHTWNTDKGVFSISIPWNRQTDTVTIGNREFIRANGNAFLVRIDANAQITAQQMRSLGSHVSFQKALEDICQQVPNDESITSLKLQK